MTLSILPQEEMLLFWGMCWFLARYTFCLSGIVFTVKIKGAYAPTIALQS